MNAQEKNQHLIWRACFGVSAEIIPQIGSLQTHSLYNQIEKKSLKKPEYIDVAQNSIKGLLMGVKDIAGMQQTLNNLSQQKKKEIRIQSREDLKNLNISWLNEMVNSEAQLREKMSLFWHGHFACRIINIYYQQLLLDEIRNNALGNFGDLLRAVSKSAAMLSFLNNQQNQKAHPNENFAREVMELFTMGRGNYTEKDVKEAARAFTGWGFNLSGEFVSRNFFHDTGDKTFLGKTGNFDGDDILDILLEQKQTAKFITQKIYKYFVNENPDDEKTEWLAERFYQGNYNIKELMNDIFTSDWFYKEENTGSKIKSPVELLAGIRRLLPMQMENDYVQLIFQRALGQLLFYPPNVAGWPGGKTWIDSSTLMLRLRIPQLIKDDNTFSLTPKVDDDQQMGMQENFSGSQKTADNMGAIGKNNFQVGANVNWNLYIRQFSSVPQEKIYDHLQTLILQGLQSSVNKKIINEMVQSTSKEEYIKTLTIALMSTPEYQLC